MGVIVVGVDGSKESLGALRFAVEEARLRQDALRVVIGWVPPRSDTYVGIPVLDPEAFEAAARRTVESMLSAVGNELGDVDVETVTEVGEAAAILAHCSDADLVVVGSRGRGGFKGLLLGSVSQKVVVHAPCPVVVVRRPDR